MINIPEPCPVSLRRMSNSECGFYCKSCTKDVVDYRGMSLDEINSKSKPGECGIFDAALVDVSYSSRSFKKQFIFYSLAFFSIMGFSVSPASAQVHKGKHPKNVELVMSQKKDDTNTKKAKKLKKRNLRFWRKKKVKGRIMVGRNF